MNRLLSSVICSHPKVDSRRFKDIIDEAIAEVSRLVKANKVEIIVTGGMVMKVNYMSEQFFEEEFTNERIQSQLGVVATAFARKMIDYQNQVMVDLKERFYDFKNSNNCEIERLKNRLEKVHAENMQMTRDITILKGRLREHDYFLGGELGKNELISIFIEQP